MKKNFLAVILVIGSVFCSYGQNTNPIDLVLLLNTSSGMGSSYENVNNYITGSFLSEFLRTGDTFHLISFSGSPRLDVARRISGTGDVETIIGRMLLQYPIEIGNDVGAAISYAEQYVSTLPSRPKKIVLVSIGGSDVSSLASAANQRLGSNATFDYVQVNPGQPLTNLPASGRPQPQRTTSTSSTAAVTSTPPQRTTTPSTTPAAQTPSTPSQQTTPTASTPTTAQQSTASQSETRTTTTQLPSTSPTSSQSETTTTNAGTQQTAGSTTTPSSSTSTDTGTTDTGSSSEVVTGNAADRDSAGYGTEAPAQGSSVQDDNNSAVSSTSAATRQSGKSSFSSLPVIIGIIILLLLLLALILFLASRKLGSSPNRVMAAASSSKNKKDKDDARVDHSKHLASYAASVSRQRTTPYADRPIGADGKSSVIDPSGPLLINMFVEDQNTSIGKRNIHNLKSGYSLSVGGGKRDGFLIFLVPLPAGIGELRRNGSSLSFIPAKAKYFPDLGSNVLSDCLNKTIRVISDKNYEMRFRFEIYEDSLAELNRILMSVKVPG